MRGPLHFKPGTLVLRFVTKSPEFNERKEFNSFASVSFVYVPGASFFLVEIKS